MTDLRVLAKVEDNPTIFTVDGKEYEIHDFRYFSDADEIKFNQMTAKDRRWSKRVAALQKQLESTNDDGMPTLNDQQFDALQAEISELQKNILSLRTEFVCMTTTLPRGVAEEIKSYDKSRVIDAVITLSNERMGKKPEDGKKPEEAEKSDESFPGDGENPS